MWFLHKKVFLTKDNLIKRKWQGSEKCCFYDQKEKAKHIFIQCPLAKNGVVYCVYVLWHHTTNMYKKYVW
jgi:hypothetical protein